MTVQDAKVNVYAEKMRDLIHEAAKNGVVLIPEMEPYFHFGQQPTLVDPYRTGISIGIANEARHPFFSTVSRVNAYAVMSTNTETGNVDVYVPDTKWPEEEAKVGLDIETASSLEPVTFHEVEGDDSPVRLYAVGEPNAANAYNRYVIGGLTFRNGPDSESRPHPMQAIDFQDGNPLTNGYNGWTIEQLLAASAHRLQGYQSGKFACTENQEALDHITLAVIALKQRTKDRIARQVKNTDKS